MFSFQTHQFHLPTVGSHFCFETAQLMLFPKKPFASKLFNKCQDASRYPAVCSEVFWSCQQAMLSCPKRWRFYSHRCNLKPPNPLWVSKIHDLGVSSRSELFSMGGSVAFFLDMDLDVPQTQTVVLCKGNPNIFPSRWRESTFLATSNWYTTQSILNTQLVCPARISLISHQTGRCSTNSSYNNYLSWRGPKWITAHPMDDLSISEFFGNPFSGRKPPI